MIKLSLIKNKNKLFIGLLFIFSLFSCSHEIKTEFDDDVIVVNAGFDFSGAVPEEMVSSLIQKNTSRAATPTTDTLKYFVEATCEGKPSVKLDNNDFEFQPGKVEVRIPLSVGDWTIEAGLKEGNNVVLSDTVRLNVTPEIPVPNVTFFLKSSVGKNGIVDLSITADSSVDSLKYIISEKSQSEQWPVLEQKRTVSKQSGKFLLNVSNVPQGIYDITLNFYSNGVFKYSSSQVINVYAGLTTNKWVSNSSTSPIKSNGVFEVTSSVISSFERFTFYIDESKGSDKIETGSYYSPYSSFSKVMEIVEKASNNSENYNIYIKDGYLGVVDKGFTINKNLNIETYKNVVGDKQGTASLEFIKSNICLFQIEQNFSCSFSGLIIDGKDLESNSDGVAINNKGDTTVENCVFKNCKAVGGVSGGAIYNDSVLKIINCSFIENKCSDEDYETVGGAVSNSGTLTLENCIFEGNSADKGKALYNNGTELMLKGTTWFNPNNDIYLSNNKFIKITETLTPKNASGDNQSVTAHILCESEQNDLCILKADSETLFTNNKEKFIVDNAGGWEIIPESPDNKNGILKQILYVSGSNSSILPAGSSTGTGTKTSPYNSLPTAISRITSNGTLIYLDGEITESSSIEISAVNGKQFVLSKLPGATKAKINYSGSGTFITTYKSIEFNGIEFNGGGTEYNRAIWALNSGTTVTLNNSSIADFRGSSDYGVVHLTARGSVWLKGNSSITGCTGGAGIYQAISSCSIKLQDSVYLDSQSTIRLASNGKVTIAGELSKSQVAKIILETYPQDINTAVLVLSDDDSGLISSNAGKFICSDRYEITSEGKLQIKSRTITFNGNAGTGFTVTNLPTSSQKCEYRTYFTLPAAPTHSDNRIFLGWSTTTDGTRKYDPGYSYYISENLTFYAIWKEPVVVSASSISDIKSAINSNSTADLRINLTSVLTIRKEDFFSINNSTVTIKGGGFKIENNFSDSGDYYLFNVTNSGVLTLDSCAITGTGNSIGDARLSAIRCLQGTVYLKNSTITSIVSNGSGAAIALLSGTLTIENSTIKNNQARNGTAIYFNNKNNAVCNMISGSITGNKAGNTGIIYGSGIFNWKGGTITSNTPASGYNVISGSYLTINNTSGKTAS